MTNAYPLELFQTVCALIGFLVNVATWLVAKTDLRFAQERLPYDGRLVNAAILRVRRERVSMVYVQGLMFLLGAWSLHQPPPPWPWDLQGIVLPWSELSLVQRKAVFFAWVWRLAISAMCLRKAWNSVQTWWDEQPIRSHRRFDDPQQDRQETSRSAQRNQEVPES